ncbi:MAG: TlpA family protein disulfide reductase [Gammaproteobacteria bacterium]|nr:TlpA family protein disulfide reductase [Gammaproteobacteria bacterium]MDH5593817.1 TlpA family protein disulfide reductase [Gammaproteobacteria bacterium]MDH5614173.1 TlpA family protein disulfide reductase [Gammaproteobacteria bacterium]
MKNKNAFAAGLILLIAGFVATVLTFSLLDPHVYKPPRKRDTPHPVEAVGMHRPDFQLPDMDGKLQHVSNWDGKVVLINFWATWCPPCLKEIPAFIDVMKSHGDKGFQVVGIAIDNRDDVMDFINSMDITYPVLWGEKDAIQLAKQLGNRIGALPYSIIMDRTGKITLTHRGELTREMLLKAINPLL